MTTPQPNVLRFAGFQLDTVSRELTAADGTVVALAAKAFEVLVHLIEHRDRVVGKDELLAVVWAGRVVEENSLTQAVSTLRRAFGAGAGDHRYILTVPGRGYRFVAALEDAGAGAAAVDAIAPRPDADDAPLGMRERPRRWPWPLWVALVLAVALFAGTALRDRSTRSAAPASAGSPPPTLVVLPFEAIGGDSPDRIDVMLGLGMAETLITRLSHSTSLRVLPLGSVQAFSGGHVDPLRAGMSLGADYVVSGSAQRHGESIRVNARLLSLPDGRTVWAGTFDETPAGVFTLQDALAEGMSAALALPYTATAGHRSPCDGSDAQAYRAYLRGRHLMFRPDRFQLPKAIIAFGEAIDLDPLCARAWAGMAFAYRSLAITADADPREAFAQARAAVDRALAIDPASAEAYATKGVIEFWHDWDWAAAEASLRHAIALDANLSEAHYALAHLLNNLERHDEAEPYARNATLLDPLSPVINAVVASFFINSGKFDEAERRLDAVLDRNPEFWLALYMRGSLAFARGDTAGAMRDLRRAADGCGHCSHAQAMLVLVYARTAISPAPNRPC
ncbi:MAG: winged helix-turn-helix domain-containing protein [Luteimonas sp.]|nr:winged helix-turn-helix domain-containing protein [Luteimonas sp.]